MRDYYEILGIDRNATDEDIKKAYRKMAMKYHPDRSSGEEAKQKMLDINEANEVLSDSKSRPLYDQYGHDWEKISQMSGGNGTGPFEEYFRRQSQGRDVHVKVTLTLEECYAGCSKSIDYTYEKVCTGCRGNKSKNGNSHHTCSSCGGTGQTISVRQRGGFMTQNIVTCRDCQGGGGIIDEPCDVCKYGGVSQGTTVEHAKVDITFPRGIGNGNGVRGNSGGHESTVLGADRGHAIFIVEQLPHKDFERIGNDLASIVDISYEDLALGTTIVVPTIHGKSTSVKIKPGTKNGELYRFKGHGMPDINFELPSNVGPGDEMVFGSYVIKLNLVVPESLSNEELELVGKLRDLKSKSLDDVK